MRCGGEARVHCAPLAAVLQYIGAGGVPPQGAQRAAQRVIHLAKARR
jgi:hypothetical protein